MNLGIYWIHSQRDPRIKVFHRSNHGLSATRNFGLSRANVRYVNFLDSDDIVCTVLYRKFQYLSLKASAFNN